MPITQQFFGSLPDQQATQLFTLSNKNRMQVQITNYGGIITSIKVPNKQGNISEVNLGFPNLEGYMQDHPYFGAIIGRYGNRIAKGKFTLEGKNYTLATNNGGNHLHGGIKGFDKIVWKAEVNKKKEAPTLILSYTSKDGEEGYPGNLNCQVTYSLSEENALTIAYQATTDKPTVLNLTNHCYFNLKDGGSSSCLEHQLQIFADTFTPIGENVLPTGLIKSVQHTPFDFLKMKKIGDRINQNNEQLKIGNGYDHNFVLNGGKKLKKAAKVVEQKSGRILEVFTTEPGIQFYTANWLKGDLVGHNGRVYQRRNAFCLETQHFPDSPNQANFPSTVLRPDEVYTSKTVYQFSIEH